MSDHRYGLNAIVVAGHDLLLTETSSSSDTVHLTREAPEGHSGRGAVQEHYFDSPSDHYAPAQRAYDRAKLLEPRWAETTLCGRQWAVMGAGEGGPLTEWSQSAVAPTCKRCLTLMDRFFPAPQPHGRLDLIVEIIVDVICGHGYAEIHGVPGDQQSVLRQRVRKSLRRQTSHNLQTHVHQSMIIFVCDAIYKQHADANNRAAADAIEAAFRGVENPDPNPDWRIHWDTWA